MAKTAKDKEPEDGVISPEEQALSYFKAHKTDHFNFEETIKGRTRASSLALTAFMDGGLEPGCHRAVGVTTGGKTSCTLDFLFNFLNEVKNGMGHRGVYFKAEGRLSDDMIKRSGVIFVTDPKEWRDGTCLIAESNVYEFVFGFMGDLIRNNPNKIRYFFIIDSMDMMGKKADLEKGLDDAVQVAGGALITSFFFKKASAALAKRGHICWFISQVRDSIRINPYGPADTPRQGKSSGGHAVEHQGDYVLEFLPRLSDDIIRTDPADKSSKPIGHFCRVKVLKSNNEKYNEIIRYPIKYGRTGGNSVWIEHEIGNLLIAWSYVEKTKSWLTWSEAIRAEIKDKIGIDVPEKIQGLDNLYSFLGENPKLISFFYEKFLNIGK